MIGFLFVHFQDAFHQTPSAKKSYLDEICKLIKGFKKTYQVDKPVENQDKAKEIFHISKVNFSNQVQFCLPADKNP
jgi:hypothetical protein